MSIPRIKICVQLRSHSTNEFWWKVFLLLCRRWSHADSLLFRVSVILKLKIAMAMLSGWLSLEKRGFLLKMYICDVVNQKKIVFNGLNVNSPSGKVPLLLCLFHAWFTSFSENWWCAIYIKLNRHYPSCLQPFFCQMQKTLFYISSQWGH